MKLLLDLTRALPNSEQSLVNRAFAAYPGLQGRDITIVRLTPQTRLLLGEDLALQSGTHYTVVAEVVFEKLRALLAIQPPDKIDVVSFHKVVFELQSRLTPEQQPRVSFRSFKSLSLSSTPVSPSSSVPQGQLQAQPELLPIQSATTPFSPPAAIDVPSTAVVAVPFPSAPPPANRWPTELMPLPEALGILEAALGSVNAVSRDKSVRHTDLRPLLSRNDQRLDKSRPLNETASR